MMTKTAIFTLLAILELVTGTNQDAPWHVRPTTVVFKSEVLGLSSGDSQCTPLGNLAVDTPSDANYVSCEGPTRITDSQKSLPVFTQDSPDSVYIWGSQKDKVLFTFSDQKDIHSLALHYFSNSDNQALPKLRFYAVPEDFEVQDEVRGSYPMTIIDEVRPGREQEGLRNKSKTVDFHTSKILMTKSYTKNYQFYLSEVEFFTNNIDSVDIVTTTSTNTPATSDSTTLSPTTHSQDTTSFKITSTTTVAESTESTISELTVGTPAQGAISSGANNLTPPILLCVLLTTLAALLVTRS